jgi:type II secretion system protein D
MFRRLLAPGLFAAAFLLGGVTRAQNVNPAAPLPGLPGQDTYKLAFPPNADVKEILAYYENLTGYRLIYDAQVTGPVPLVINTPVTKDEAIKIIETALLMNQFSLVPTENPKIWKVLGIGKNPRSAGVPIYTEAEMLPETEQVVSFLFKLNYADPTELAQTLGQAFPPNPVLQGASITALPKAGALLVTENTAIIRQIIRIVRELDVQPAKVESRFFTLARADAKDLQEKLTDILTKKDAAAAAAPGAPGQPGTRPAITRLQTTPEGLPLPQGTPAEAASTTVELNIGPTEENIIAGKIKITADVRTNRIHIVTRPENMKFIADLIEDFDANVPFGEPTTYPLRYVNASDIFEVLVKAVSDLGQEGQPGATGGAGQTNRPAGSRTGSTGQSLFSGTNTNRGNFDGTGGFGGPGGGGGGTGATLSESLNTQERDIIPKAVTIGNARVIADNRANSIIVVGNEDVKQKVFAVVKQLDIRAPQVMLHVCIGQLTLTESEQFGVNYIINQGRDLGNFAGTSVTGQNGNTVTTGGAINAPAAPGLNIAALLGQEQIRNIAIAGASGFSGFFTAGNAFDAIVTALESTNKFRVTSRPVLFTSNNKKAIISSGTQIAVPTNIQSGFNGGINNNNVVSNSQIQFKDVALTLEVLPLINAEGEVSMDIVQKIDEQNGTTRIDNNDIPKINSNALQTNVTVPSGATLALGGLIKARNNKAKTGVPLISRIPLIGALFRTTSYDKTREELVILIRPVVTNTPSEAVKESDREHEFLNMEPDMEYSLITPQQRQRLPASEVKLRAPAGPGLREEAGRATYVAPPPRFK